MSNGIVILTVPGIGTQKQGYSEDLEEKIHKYSKSTALEGNYRILESRPFSITEIDDNQEALFRRLERENKLGGILSLRKFVIEAFGDGVTFERNPFKPDSPYQRIHKYLKERIEEANALLNSYDNAKLVIVAGSLGVHIVSTYIWDADRSQGLFNIEPATEKNNLRNLSYLASIGCNIPLFVSGLPESKIVAFDKRNDEFTWDNYYDRDDVLGWPLKQLSASYTEMVKDYEINTGLYIGAHIRYWGDKDFAKPFTQKLISLIESMQ